MTPRNLTVRDRLNLVRRPMQTLQVLTYVAGFTFVLVVMFADPGHRLAIAAIEFFAALCHAIIH